MRTVIMLVPTCLYPHVCTHMFGQSRFSSWIICKVLRNIQIIVKEQDSAVAIVACGFAIFDTLPLRS